MKYYQLKDRATDNYGMIKWPNLDPKQSFLNGKQLPENLPSLVFEVDYPDLNAIPHFIDGGIPIVSTVFGNVLNAAGVNNFQLFPAVVVNSTTGESRDDYYAFNILGLLQAADMDASDSTLIMQGDSSSNGIPLAMFHKFAYKRKKSWQHSTFSFG